MHLLCGDFRFYRVFLNYSVVNERFRNQHTPVLDPIRDEMAGCRDQNS